MHVLRFLLVTFSCALTLCACDNSPPPTPQPSPEQTAGFLQGYKEKMDRAKGVQKVMDDRTSDINQKLQEAE